MLKKKKKEKRPLLVLSVQHKTEDSAISISFKEALLVMLELKLFKSYANKKEF